MTARERDIVTGNCEIAKYMGSALGLNYPEYHADWRKLMPVLEKICRTQIGDGIKYVKFATPITFGMVNEESGKLMVRLEGHQLFMADTLIEALWLAVVDYVKYESK